MNSPLARLCGKSATSPDKLQQLRQDAWQRQGVAVLRPDEIRDAWTRQAVINEANRQYGRREAKPSTPRRL